MTPLFNFGISQEDERTEAAALSLPGGRVLSVASAGDMPLSLLALGAERVTAVDLDAGQLHLLRLKLGAVRALDREEAIAFLGYLPADGGRRSAWLDRVLPALDPDSRQFWEAQRPHVRRGIIWEGRYERFVRRAVRLTSPLLGRRFRALLACETIEEQQTLYDRRFDGVLLRSLFRVVFHPRVFSSRGMDPRSLRHRTPGGSLGDQYLAWFRRLCTATPARDNHLLQLHVLGRVVHADSVPAYLNREGFETVRARHAALVVREADLVTLVRAAEPGAFDACHLSNVPDWLDQARFDALLEGLARIAVSPMPVVWRYIHVDRKVPSRLRDRIAVDTARGAALRQTDRFPFYAIVPAVCALATAAAGGE